MTELLEDLDFLKNDHSSLMQYDLLATDNKLYKIYNQSAIADNEYKLHIIISQLISSYIFFLNDTGVSDQILANSLLTIIPLLTEECSVVEKKNFRLMCNIFVYMILVTCGIICISVVSAILMAVLTIKICNKQSCILPIFADIPQQEIKKIIARIKNYTFKNIRPEKSSTEISREKAIEKLSTEIRPTTNAELIQVVDYNEIEKMKKEKMKCSLVNANNTIRKNAVVKITLYFVLQIIFQFSFVCKYLIFSSLYKQQSVLLQRDFNLVMIAIQEKLLIDPLFNQTLIIKGNLYHNSDQYFFESRLNEENITQTLKYKSSTYKVTLELINKLNGNFCANVNSSYATTCSEIDSSAFIKGMANFINRFLYSMLSMLQANVSIDEQSITFSTYGMRIRRFCYR
jgi:hypothetical protein